MTVDDVVITAGAMLVIDGEVGTYKFRYVDKCGSITCWGGTTGHESWRSFKPDRCHLVGWVRPRNMDDDNDDVDAQKSRKFKYSALEEWARAHDGEQFTTADIVAQSGFSYQTALKFIDSSPLFYKIKKGLYECRNDRARRSK